MQKFSGLEIKPYSQLTELPRVRIDRVRVEVQRTLFGETEYHLVGTMGDEGKAYPICAPFTELPDVWERKKEVESAIFKARQEEQYARKEKDAGYLEDTRKVGLNTGDRALQSVRPLHILHARMRVYASGRCARAVQRGADRYLCAGTVYAAERRAVSGQRRGRRPMVRMVQSRQKCCGYR